MQGTPFAACNSTNITNLHWQPKPIPNGKAVEEMRSKLTAERKKLLKSIERFLDAPMIFLGFVWLILLLVELIWGLPPVLDYINFFIWSLFILNFIIEYILAPAKGQFLKTNWLTAVSLIIPALRVLRVFRFVRVLRSLRGIRLVRLVSSINRSMKSLSATMSRRGFGYIFTLTLAVTFVGAAGMYAIEKPSAGFTSYGEALWWSSMRIITAGSEYYPLTAEGKALAFLLALYGYAIFGYVTATIATFFIGRDAEEKDTPVAGSNEIAELRRDIAELKALIQRNPDYEK